MYYTAIQYPVSTANLRQMNINFTVYYENFFSLWLIRVVSISKHIGLNNSVYSWIVVFIVPINSVMNPFLYSSKEFQNNLKKKFDKKKEDRNKIIYEKELLERGKSKIFINFSLNY